MTIIQSLIVSIVEGITEFLPISSTGHMILASRLLGIPQTDFVKTFEIFIQCGAILAVVFLFFKKIKQTPTLIPKIGVAFLPTALIGFALYKVVKHFLLGNSFITVLSLVLGGIFLIIFENVMKEKQGKTPLSHLLLPKAGIIGLFQSISIIPGVSRSAATIVGGMVQGLSREEAVEFSFMLAVPTLAAASGYDLLKSSISMNSQELLLLVVGFGGAFISAFLTIKWFLGFVKTHTFLPFAYYRIVAGILFWLIVLR